MVAAEAVAVAMAVAKTSCSARLLLDDHFTELLLHTRHRQPEQVCQALHRHARVACCDDLDVVLCDARGSVSSMSARSDTVNSASPKAASSAASPSLSSVK